MENKDLTEDILFTIKAYLALTKNEKFVNATTPRDLSTILSTLLELLEFCQGGKGVKSGKLTEEEELEKFKALLGKESK